MSKCHCESAITNCPLSHIQFLSLSKAGCYQYGSIWCRYASFNTYEFDIYKFQPTWVGRGWRIEDDLGLSGNACGTDNSDKIFIRAHSPLKDIEYVKTNLNSDTSLEFPIQTVVACLHLIWSHRSPSASLSLAGRDETQLSFHLNFPSDTIILFPHVVQALGLFGCKGSDVDVDSQ